MSSRYVNAMVRRVCTDVAAIGKFVTYYVTEMKGFKDLGFFKGALARRKDSFDVRPELPASLMPSHGYILFGIVNTFGIKRAGRTKESICKTIVRPNDSDHQGVGSGSECFGQIWIRF